jgi:hypothetical protein
MQGKKRLSYSRYAKTMADGNGRPSARRRRAERWRVDLGASVLVVAKRRKRLSVWLCADELGVLDE